MRFVVQWRYVSGLGGPWAKGEVVELDSEELAEAVNRDSPGVLKRYVEKPPKDRQVKKASRARQVKA